jgi:hypothetical protein
MPRFSLKESYRQQTSCAGLSLIGQCCEVAQVDQMALIIVPATTLRRQRRQIGRLGRARSSSRRSWGQRHALEHLREQRFVGTAKETLGGSRAIGATDMVVVNGGERCELAVAEPMATMVMQSQLTVAALHPGTAALEAIGAFTGHLFQACEFGGRQGAQRMCIVAQRFEQLAAQPAQSVTRLGMGATRGDAIQIQGRDELFDERALQCGGAAREPRPATAAWRRKR